MDFRPTKKGLLRGEFIDRFGQTCSVQESSQAGEDCIWLGVEVDREGKEVPNGRMHLTRDQAKSLIPVLRHFVREGTLGQDEPLGKFHIGAWVLGVAKFNRGVEGRIISITPGGPTADAQVVVQDRYCPGDAGQYLCLYAQADLYWVPIDVPESIPTRYERLRSETDPSED